MIALLMQDKELAIRSNIASGEPNIDLLDKIKQDPYKVIQIRRQELAGKPSKQLPSD